MKKKILPCIMIGCSLPGGSSLSRVQPFPGFGTHTCSDEDRVHCLRGALSDVFVKDRVFGCVILTILCQIGDSNMHTGSLSASDIALN